MHVTGDPARMLARLKPIARFPRNLRVERVRYSERELDRVENRVERGLRPLRKAGFTVAMSEADLDANRVLVELATRTDRRRRVLRQALRARGPHAGHRARADEPRMRRRRPVRDRARRHEPDSSAGRPAAARRPSASRSPSTRTGSRSGSSSVYRSGRARSRRAARPRSLRSARRSALAPSTTPAYGARMLQSGPAPGRSALPGRARSSTPLEQAIAQRAEYGMNADPAYVQALLADDREYTEPERKWIKQLQRLDYESDVNEYLDHWRKDWGGTNLVADYPAKPYQVDPARPPARVPHQEPQAADEVARAAADGAGQVPPTTTSGSSSSGSTTTRAGRRLLRRLRPDGYYVAPGVGQRRDPRRRDQGDHDPARRRRSTSPRRYGELAKVTSSATARVPWQLLG